MSIFIVTINIIALQFSNKLNYNYTFCQISFYDL